MDKFVPRERTDVAEVMTARVAQYAGEAVERGQVVTLGQANDAKLIENEYLRRLSESEEPIPCEACGKAFASVPWLNHHVRACGKESTSPWAESVPDPKTCSECGETFAKSGQVMYHMAVHHPRCRFCGERFTNVNWLRNHETVDHYDRLTFRVPYGPGESMGDRRQS